jgi:hypothetical protein
MSIEVQFELEFLRDGLDDVRRIHAALSGRHGNIFRRLDRDIEALVKNAAHFPPEVAYLGEGICVVSPHPAFIKIIRRARALRIDFRPKG